MKTCDRVRCEFIPRYWDHNLIVGKIYTVDKVTGYGGEFKIVGDTYTYYSKCFTKIGTMNLQKGDRVRWDGHWTVQKSWDRSCDYLTKGKVYTVKEVLQPSSSTGLIMVKLKGMYDFWYPAVVFTQVVFKPHGKPATLSNGVATGMAAPPAST